MTPHRVEVKPEIGVRELHDKLSQYLQHVAAGGEIVVTMRGRRIARLSPVDPSDPFENPRARGLVREPSRPKPALRGRLRIPTSRSVAELVAEQRR